MEKGRWPISAMQDYSGSFRPDFSWSDLDKKTRARLGREIMLCNQVHDRAIMPIIHTRFGAEAMTALAIDEWMGASPVYNRRNRLLHGIEGDGVDVIMKGFQLDIGAPHMWLKFHYDVQSHDLGFFWLPFCGAYHHVRALTGGDVEAERQICVHMEDPTFDATVMAVNPGARCTPIYRPPHGGEIPAAGPCRWQVSITDGIGVVEENALTDRVRQSRAGQFEFAFAQGGEDGLRDYSGPFKRDFRLEDLADASLTRQLYEFALDVHLLQRACYMSIERQFGQEALGDILREHAAAMAPVYHARMRRLLGIEGDTMSSVLKLLQLDHHLVPEYVGARCVLDTETSGYLLIDDCAALGDGDPAGLLTGLWRGETWGLEQIVQAVNPRARVQPAAVPGAALAFAITIDDGNEPVPPSPWSDLVGMNGLLEVDLAEHHYDYTD